MNRIYTLFVSFFLISVIVASQVSFAKETNDYQSPNRKEIPQAAPGNLFPGLVGWVAAILTSAGITYIAIGAAVIVGGYIIYRVAQSTWTYYKAYSYSKWYDHHAYQKHIQDVYEFENIWGNKKPSRKQFEKRCKETINNKSSRIWKFIQKGNKRLIAYDSLTNMVVVGETDGKTI